MSGFLRFENITRKFGPVVAVDNVTLEVGKGEFFSLLGPSGCGKTTLLRMTAGFDLPDAGRILLDGHDITELPPDRRPVNTIFQSYALFPHLTVRQNIAFGPRIAGKPRTEIEHETNRLLALIQMEKEADRKPDQISGGQKQRVAIARALINKPSVLLLDEPLAALDLKLRQRMLAELQTLQKNTGITFVFVTHDQDEAMSVSDRIAVMNKGRVQQVGTPGEIYETPINSFTAAFIGDTNFFAGRVTAMNPDNFCTVSVPGFMDVLCFQDQPRKVGDEVHLSIRPEKFTIAPKASAPTYPFNETAGIVQEALYLGSNTRFKVAVRDVVVSVIRQHRHFQLDEPRIHPGDHVFLRWHGDDGFMLERDDHG